MLPILTNMSFRVSKSLRDQFSQTAQQNDRNASQLLRDYMRIYIDQHRGTSFDKSTDLDFGLGLGSSPSPSLATTTAAQSDDPVQSAAVQQEIAAAKEQAIRTERLQYRLRQCLRKRYSDFY